MTSDVSLKTDSERSLVEAARKAAVTGPLAMANEAWARVLQLNPQNVEALFFIGRLEMQKHDFKKALEHFSLAAELAPGRPEIPLHISFIAEATGNFQLRYESLQRALMIEPRFVPALLEVGRLFESRSNLAHGALYYRRALKLIQLGLRVPQVSAELIERAKRATEIDSATREENYRACLEREGLVGLIDDEQLQEIIQIAAESKRAFVSEPTGFHFPGLPSTAFFKKDLVPWLSEIEQLTDVIASEFCAAEHLFKDLFQPYVSKAEGSPIDQWQELNNNHRWSSIFLWKDGQRQERACSIFQKTMRVLDLVPRFEVFGLAPTMFFSRLDANTTIPPHTGVTNARAIAHLPIIVPKSCGFRVGNVVREFERGKAWVFDDTIEHEAWNRSADERIILIFEIWNPNMSQEQQRIARHTLEADFRYAASNGSG